MKTTTYAPLDRQEPESHNRNPWKWIPTLYFAEALPYVAVMTISTVMYERLGLSNAEIAFYTSMLYLPWAIKPLWSPFVDLARSKRWWILAMELLIAVAIAGDLPYSELWISYLYSCSNCCSTSVNGVHTVCVHIIRQT